jgi:hypothetical protein
MAANAIHKKLALLSGEHWTRNRHRRQSNRGPSALRPDGVVEHHVRTGQLIGESGRRAVATRSRAPIATDESEMVLRAQLGNQAHHGRKSRLFLVARGDQRPRYAVKHGSAVRDLASFQEEKRVSLESLQVTHASSS